MTHCPLLLLLQMLVAGCCELNVMNHLPLALPLSFLVSQLVALTSQMVALHDVLGEEGVNILQCEEGLQRIGRRRTALQQPPVTWQR